VKKIWLCSRKLRPLYTSSAEFPVEYCVSATWRRVETKSYALAGFQNSLKFGGFNQIWILKFCLNLLRNSQNSTPKFGLVCIWISEPCVKGYQFRFGIQVTCGFLTRPVWVGVILRVWHEPGTNKVERGFYLSFVGEPSDPTQQGSRPNPAGIPTRQQPSPRLAMPRCMYFVVPPPKPYASSEFWTPASCRNGSGTVAHATLFYRLGLMVAALAFSW
jgi:hypothetical protein